MDEQQPDNVIKFQGKVSHAKPPPLPSSAQPPPLPSQRETGYRFEDGFSQAEEEYVRDVLVEERKKKMWGCMVMFFAFFVFTFVKLLTIYVSFVFIPLILGALLYQQWAGVRFWKVNQGAGMVVWLRRFHRDDLRSFPFGSCLQMGCGNGFTPVTIQDSTYRHSWDALVSRGVLVLILVFMSAFLVALLASILTAYLLGCITGLFFSEDTSALIAGGVAMCVFFPILFVSTVRFYRRAGYHKLRKRDAVKKFGDYTQKVSRGKTSCALQIFQSGDDYWKDVVQAALQKADVVVVDVTSIGRNVEWELNQVRESVSPERTVLCCASQNGRLMCNEVELIKSLLRVFRKEELDRMRRISYQVPVRKLNLFERVMRDYPPYLLFRHKDSCLDIVSAVILARIGEPRMK